MSSINRSVDGILIVLEALLDAVNSERELGSNFKALLEEFIDEMAVYRQVDERGNFFYVAPEIEPSKSRSMLKLVS